MSTWTDVIIALMMILGVVYLALMVNDAEEKYAPEAPDDSNL